LFLLFFYFFLNSSQESTYFYDENIINKIFLSSLQNVYFSYILLILMIFFFFFIILNINSFGFGQILLLLFVCFFILIYFFLIETYQFYYLVTFFSNFCYFFNEDLNLWCLDSNLNSIRLKKQYFYIILLLKYWHFLFIFCSILFVFCKNFEQKSVSYQLFGFSSQNLLVFFFLNVLLNLQWIKWILLRFMEIPYFWFFNNYNFSLLTCFIDEFVIFLRNIFCLFI
jgi:hypothetical protein